LTQLQPPDLQSAQLSVPFSLAMALSLGRTRGAQAAIRREDYEAALGSDEIRALAGRVRCVLIRKSRRARTPRRFRRE
jgi:hypothetical protein